MLISVQALSATSDAGTARGAIDGRREVAPGVAYWEETWPQIPRVLHVLQIDLSRAQYRFEARSGTSETLSADRPTSLVLMEVGEIAAKAASDGLDVVAAINGDYWEPATGRPLGVMVESGVAHRIQNGRAALLVGKDHYGSPRQISIDRQPVTIRLRRAPVAGRAEETTVSAFNHLPARDGLGLLTDEALAGSIAAKKLAEVYSIEGARADLCNQWQPGQLRKFQQPAPGQKLALDPSQPKVFIAARNAGAKWLGRMAQSRAPMSVRIDFASVGWPVWSAVGGNPMLVSHGHETDDTALAPFAPTPEPRTAVGIDANASTMWWVVVDGRKPGYSAGATLRQLADFMKALGASEAINLDGGGSSTLWLDGKVVNQPSDWRGPRGVANALLLCRRKGG
jgi:hypothetical protein